MIQHFKNLQTPLKNVDSYPGLRDQEQRFLQAGWSTATARSLCNLWNDTAVVPKDQRLTLNGIEPFDEWEEFILFASHYFLLVADRSSSSESHSSSQPLCKEAPKDLMNDVGEKIISANSEILPKPSMRRFGALVQLSSDSVGHHGGLGSQSRVGTMDVYSLSDGGFVVPPYSYAAEADIEPRMCHTITASNHEPLLVGGRTSPNQALQDCWQLIGGCWCRSEDLQMPLFRHSATEVMLGSDNSSGVLVYGGKTQANQVCNKWFLWRGYFGWVEVVATEHQLRPRFGAAMISNGNRTGILLGGMEADGTILDELWEWTLFMDKEIPMITLQKCEVLAIHPRQFKTIRSASGQNVIGRMGASLTKSPIGILLIGGVGSEVLAQDQEIVCLSKNLSIDPEENTWHYAFIDCQIGGSRPLLVGHSIILLQDSVIIVGGGAVCFSFGTFWNSTVVTLSAIGQRIFTSSKDEHRTRKAAATVPPLDNSVDHATSLQSHPRYNDPTSVVRIRIESPADFRKVMNQRRPVTVSGMDLGTCIRGWTLDVLKAKIGHDRNVSLQFPWFFIMLTVADCRTRSHRRTDGFPSKELQIRQEALQCLRRRDC